MTIATVALERAATQLNEAIGSLLETELSDGKSKQIASALDLMLLLVLQEAGRYSES